MTKKEFKEKVKKNKGKIIVGTTFLVVAVAGSYIVYSKNTKILELSKRCNILEERVDQDEADIKLLGDVMTRDVIGTVKESLKRRLRYHEGRLNNSLIKCSNITEEDVKMHQEEIAAITQQLKKVDIAESKMSKRGYGA